jgi:HTH-type transcriptional regulator, sugar sensing transcriptional regulator
MSKELAAMDFDRLWRRLQQIGLNAYEARTYLVLVGHPRFKALELASRSNVPRQKIYEVLDSLAEKGFAQVVQEKTKLFSAVEPALAVPNYIARRHQLLETELMEQGRIADGLVEDLNRAYSEGQEGRGTLDYLRIVALRGRRGHAADPGPPRRRGLRAGAQPDGRRLPRLAAGEATDEALAALRRA